MTEQAKCPYCGTVATENVHTKRSVCECRRMHEYKKLNGGKYAVVYHPNRTKEIIQK